MTIAGFGNFNLEILSLKIWSGCLRGIGGD